MTFNYDLSLEQFLFETIRARHRLADHLDQNDWLGAPASHESAMLAGGLPSCGGGRWQRSDRLAAKALVQRRLPYADVLDAPRNEWICATTAAP